jgi:hypothetical protein
VWRIFTPSISTDALTQKSATTIVVARNSAENVANLRREHLCLSAVSAQMSADDCLYMVSDDVCCELYLVARRWQPLSVIEDGICHRPTR